MSSTKISVNLPDEAIQVLRDLASRRSVTMTDVLRDAIATEKFLDDVNQKRGKVLVEDAKGDIRQIIFK